MERSNEMSMYENCYFLSGHFLVIHRKVDKSHKNSETIKRERGRGEKERFN